MKIILKKNFSAYFFKDEFMFIFMDVGVFPSVCLHTTSMQCPWKPRRTVDPLKSAVTDSCEPPFGCWESIPGPLEE